MDKHRIDRLLIRISEGDNDAFGELYEKTRRGVFSFIYTYLHNYHDAEDAMQTVYLKVKRNIHSYTHGTNAVAWILGIAKFESIDRLRTRKYHEDIDGVAEPEYDLEDGSIFDLLERTLNEEEARIVTLHVIWKYKHREIGEMIGSPTGTVTSKYKRAIEKLKKAIKEAEV